VPEAIDSRRVDPVDTEFEGAMDGGDRVGIVLVSPTPISVMFRSELPSLRVIIVYLHLGATVGHWCRRPQVF
jgi:hypothetical protein